MNPMSCGHIAGWVGRGTVLAMAAGTFGWWPVLIWHFVLRRWKSKDVSSNDCLDCLTSLLAAPWKWGAPGQVCSSHGGLLSQHPQHCQGNWCQGIPVRIDHQPHCVSELGCKSATGIIFRLVLDPEGCDRRPSSPDDLWRCPANLQLPPAGFGTRPVGHWHGSISLDARKKQGVRHWMNSTGTEAYEEVLKSTHDLPSI